MAKRKIIRHKEAVDWWSLAHFLGWIVVADFFVQLNLVKVGFFISLIAMIAWEFLEYQGGIRESWDNRNLDVILGILGFVVGVVL